MIARRGIAAAFVALLAVALTPSGAAARTADDNVAVAVNTEDGASVFRLAFSVRQVNNSIVDQTNTAAALASCTDCQTVALAFQVVLVQRDADVVAPENLAIAYNAECVLCTTYASATQLVLGFDSRIRLTGSGQQRLAALHQALRDLEEQAGTMTLVELDAAVQAAKAELVAILETELVAIETPPPPTSTTSSTSSTSTTSSSSTSTTDATESTSTTTTSEPSSTTTTDTTATSTTDPETTTTTTEAP